MDSDDSAGHFYPHSRDTSSSSAESDSDAPPMAHSSPLQGQDMDMLGEGDMDDEHEENMDVCPAPPPQPVLVHLNVIEQPPDEEPPARDEEVEKAALSIAEDEVREKFCCVHGTFGVVVNSHLQQILFACFCLMFFFQETEHAVQSIFDDCDEDPDPEYPSHDFIHNEETVPLDQVPVEISEVRLVGFPF